MLARQAQEATREATAKVALLEARINDVSVSDEMASLSRADLKGDVVKLSLGRKKHVLLKAV